MYFGERIGEAVLEVFAHASAQLVADGLDASRQVGDLLDVRVLVEMVDDVHYALEYDRHVAKIRLAEH